MVAVSRASQAAGLAASPVPGKSPRPQASPGGLTRRSLCVWAVPHQEERKEGTRRRGTWLFRKTLVFSKESRGQQRRADARKTTSGHALTYPRPRVPCANLRRDSLVFQPTPSSGGDECGSRSRLRTLGQRGQGHDGSGLREEGGALSRPPPGHSLRKTPRRQVPGDRTAGPSPSPPHHRSADAKDARAKAPGRGAGGRGCAPAGGTREAQAAGPGQTAPAAPHRLREEAAPGRPGISDPR